MKFHLKIFFTLTATLIILTIIFIVSNILTTQKINEKLQESIDNLSQTTSENSQKIIEEIAIENIRDITKSVANHLEIYLHEHPENTLSDLFNSNDFKNLATQPIQKSGYTSLLDMSNMLVFIHKHSQFEGILISSLKKGTPELYRIMINGSHDFSSEGRYSWTDPDGITREKYAHIINLKHRTKDNTKLALISTAYLDEYSLPMTKINKRILATGDKTKINIQKTILKRVENTTIIILFCMTLLFFFYALIIKKLISPIYELVKATDDMSTGNFDIRAKNTGKDEIGQLARSFNKMAESIQERDWSLRQANEELEKRVDQRTLELKEANLKIKQANEKLEERVKTRTHELENALNALKESEETFRALTENSDDTIMRFNRSFIHLYTNPSVRKLTGIPAEDFIGKTHAEIGFPQPLVTMWEKAIEHTFNTGEKNRIEFLLDGPNVWIDWLLFPEFDDKGNVKAVITSARDITELKKTEEALRNSEKLLSTTLKSVVEAVITTDTDRKITFMNPPAEFLTGFKLAEAKNKKLSDVLMIIDETNRETFKACPVSQILDVHKAIDFSGDIAIVSKNSKERPITMNGSPIIDDKNMVVGVVLVFRDITLIRKHEAQLRNQQKLESLGTLSSGVAHEINNPIGIIMNYGELILQDAQPDSQTAEDAKQIIQESARIAKIVKNLLSFSRHEKESRSMVNMEEIIDNTLSLTSKLLKKDQVIIEKNIADSIPQIYCNSQEIMQVFMNLLTNSRDALSDKYPEYNENKKIIISCKSIENNGTKWLRTSFEDFGNGIPEEIQQRIFDPFFTSKGRDRGTGLGLSISYGIIKEHNGKMEMKTEPGHGTTFFVDLPINQTA